jgi:drug/metabolite transporter (DMT)-like permease
MVWATSLGFAIFGQLPDRWSALGIAIIVASGLWLALQERWSAPRA